MPWHPTNPQNQQAIAQLETKLRKVSLGQTITYDELAINAFDIRTHHRHLLVAAIERTEKALGACFECVRTVGYQRVSSEGIPDVGLHAVRRCRSAARRGKQRIDRVNVNSLSESAGRRLRGYSAMLGAIRMLSDGRKAESIALVADPDRQIPPQAILDMFRHQSS